MILSKILDVYRLEGVRGIGSRIGRRMYWWVHPVAEEISWQIGYVMHPFRRTGSPTVRHRVIKQKLEDFGLPIDLMQVDVVGYQEYMAKAIYPPNIYNSAWAIEKSLEHFLSLQCLDIKACDVLIDIASAASPFPDIARRLYGCKVYRQDLTYAPGFNGDRIGGNAATLPLSNDFATKMTLHCSFEHFEGDSDTKFIYEAARVLRPGGRACILPLYMNEEYCILTNPFADRSGMPVDDEAQLRFVRYWPGGRHGRYYDIDHLYSRILCHCPSLFKVSMRFVDNPEAVSDKCYVRFILLLEKL